MLTIVAVASDNTKTIEIDKKSIVVADKGTYIIVVIDLNPYTSTLEEIADKSHVVLVATAQKYAKIQLMKNEFSSRKKAVVYFISVKNMDEYNRANFDGMKRFGKLTFEKITETKINLTVDELTYK